MDPVCGVGLLARPEAAQMGHAAVLCEGCAGGRGYSHLDNGTYPYVDVRSKTWSRAQAATGFRTLGAFRDRHVLGHLQGLQDPGGRGPFPDRAEKERDSGRLLGHAGGTNSGHLNGGRPRRLCVDGWMTVLWCAKQFSYSGINGVGH